MTTSRNKLTAHHSTFLIIVLLIVVLLGISAFSYFSIQKQNRNLQITQAKNKTITINRLIKKSIDGQQPFPAGFFNTLDSLNKNQYFWIINDQGKIIYHPHHSIQNKQISKVSDKIFTNSYSRLQLFSKEEGTGTLKLLLPDTEGEPKKQLWYLTSLKSKGWNICYRIHAPETTIGGIKITVFPFLFAGSGMVLLIIYLIVYRHPATEKSRELLETEKKYKTLFNAANDGILLIEKYRFVDCNFKALEIFGADKTDLIGATPDQFSPQVQPDGSNSYDKAIDIIDKCISGEKQFFEWKHKTKEGAEFFAEVSVNKIEIAKREMLLAIVRDISPRKTLEEKLIRAKNRAEESDRLKSAFLANTSHEIRTPMNAIMGFSRLLQAGKIDEDKRNEYTQNIIEKGDHLLQVINDIIDVSKIEANQLNINKTHFNLNDLMDEIFVTITNQQEPNDNIEFRLAKEGKNSHFIRLDQNRVKQILHNLLSNAFKYTDEGKIEFGYELQDKETILFFVKDTGIGIDKDKQPFIFDSFRKSDTSSTRLYGGTGLGLSISKALVELMGGKIWVESNLNKGAEFYFILPYEPAHKVSDSKKNKNEELVCQWEGKVILIVEDDKLSFEYLKEIMKDSKAEIQQAKDGQSAIDMCRKNKNIDLVLMDIQLPGVDGTTATKEIRKFNQELPIIAQTAYALEEEKDKILEAGCNDYISKPINEKILCRKINKFLAS